MGIFDKLMDTMHLGNDYEDDYDDYDDGQCSVQQR